MIAHRCASMLLFSRLSYPPRLLSPFRSSHSSLLHRSSPSSSLRIGLCWVDQPRRRRTRAFGTTSAVAQDRNGAETFFAEEGVSWASLGVSDRLTSALSTVGIVRPSLVQVLMRCCALSFRFKTDVLHVVYENTRGSRFKVLIVAISTFARNLKYANIE